jgi:hypothetical protein
MRPRIRIGTFVLALALAATATGQETDDASSLAPTFQEGDVITFEQTDKLRPFLPEPFWDNRDFFFHEGMRLEIGPTQRDYSSSPEFRSATEFYRGQARIGPPLPDRRERLPGRSAGRRQDHVEFPVARR